MLPMIDDKTMRWTKNGHLIANVLNCLQDSVFVIREAACVCFCKLTKDKGREFLRTVVTSRLTDIAINSCYLRGLTCLEFV